MKIYFVSISVITGISIVTMFLLRKRNRSAKKCSLPWLRTLMNFSVKETFRETNLTICRKFFKNYFRGIKLHKTFNSFNKNNFPREKTEILKTQEPSVYDVTPLTIGKKSIFGIARPLIAVYQNSRYYPNGNFTPNSTFTWKTSAKSFRIQAKSDDMEKDQNQSIVLDRSQKDNSWTTVQYLQLSDEKDNREDINKNHLHPMLKKFQFVRIIAKGSFGEVALAKDSLTKEYVAIKSIKKLKRLLGCIKRENMVFALVNSSSHPFLINKWASFQIKTHVFFVMEYFPGGDLYLHVRNTSLSALQQQAIFYSACVVMAVEFLHSHNIIHRDLKLQNILMCKDGYVKVTDYGLSRKLYPGYYAHSVCGTLTHMAPEVLNKELYTKAIDWWSMGIVLYEMLTKKCPFMGREKKSILNLIYKNDIDFPPYLNAGSVDIIGKFLKRNPDERLGNRISGVEEIKQHPFYQIIDWDDLIQRKLQPPFIPTMSHLQNKVERETDNWPPFTNEQTDSFIDTDLDNFSYLANWLQVTTL
ncbi:serine/threonine-protein kinase N2-like [Centruroides sculpturatus]|uniref:serine/threonine-protein kinase N2-like n=1 Tax=Centruroides sculpturatus TaxID=218467 RepID=UPI000C6E0E30|nr:serine/threonine-protein kinase N2-like [Centruroides sculpturatus]